MSGIPCHQFINATFIHTNPLACHFNGPDRGAGYAGFELETAQAEIAWHKSIEFAEFGWTEQSVTYDVILADFSGEYHDIRGDADFQNFLDPNSYVNSQSLAETLLEKHGSSIIYPIVRHNDGICLLCFHPSLVGNVRRCARYRFTWTGQSKPEILLEETYTEAS